MERMDQLSAEQLAHRQHLSELQAVARRQAQLQHTAAREAGYSHDLRRELARKSQQLAQLRASCRRFNCPPELEQRYEMLRLRLQNLGGGADIFI